MDMKTRRVIDHLDQLNLSDVRFVVSKSGQQKVRERKVKNVHAFAEGYWDMATTCHNPAGSVRIRYNPYQLDKFVTIDAVPVDFSDQVHFDADGKMYGLDPH